MAVDLDRLTENQQDLLDFLVDDVVSKQATAINNSGPKAQVDYLLSQGETLDSITEALESEED